MALNCIEMIFLSDCYYEIIWFIFLNNRFKIEAFEKYYDILKL